MCHVPEGCWRQCPCGEWFIEPCYSAIQMYCEKCRLQSFSFDTLPEMIDDTVERYVWEKWNVLVKGGLENFMYKMEDGWLTWTEAYFVDTWADGIVYRSKDVANLIEAILDFTGIPNQLGATVTVTEL